MRQLCGEVIAECCIRLSHASQELAGRHRAGAIPCGYKQCDRAVIDRDLERLPAFDAPKYLADMIAKLTDRDTNRSCHDHDCSTCPTAACAGVSAAVDQENKAL